MPKKIKSCASAHQQEKLQVVGGCFILIFHKELKEIVYGGTYLYMLHGGGGIYILFFSLNVPSDFP